MCTLFVKKFQKCGQTKLNTVHRVKTEHTGKVWEGKEQPGKVFSAKWVYMVRAHLRHSQREITTKQGCCEE